MSYTFSYDLTGSWIQISSGENFGIQSLDKTQIVLYFSDIEPSENDKNGIVLDKIEEIYEFKDFKGKCWAKTRIPNAKGKIVVFSLGKTTFIPSGYNEGQIKLNSDSSGQPFYSLPNKQDQIIEYGSDLQFSSFPEYKARSAAGIQR